MRWKRLNECPACGKDRCVLVPFRRAMLWCYRLNKAYWIKKDGSIKELPRYSSFSEDNSGKAKEAPLFASSEKNLFDPENPYHPKGEKKMNRSTIKNNSRKWTRSFCYDFFDYLLNNLKFKNGSLFSIGLVFTSKTAQENGLKCHFELVFKTKKEEKEFTVISKFYFSMGEPAGRINLEENLCPSPEMLNFFEEKINQLLKDFQAMTGEAFKEKLESEIESVGGKLV